MKKFFLTILVAAGLFLASQAHAQAANVNINTGVLTWDWTQGVAPNDGLPTVFRMKCGQATGVYTKLTDVVYPTKILSVKNAITGQGSWFCIVTAVNAFGESGASNELPFVAGAIPSSTTNLRLQ